MLQYLLYSGCGLCYREEYDQQIREAVVDMKKEDKAIESWRSEKRPSPSKEESRKPKKTPVPSKEASSPRSRSKRTRFEGYDDEPYSEQDFSSPQQYRVQVRPRKTGLGCWDTSAVTMSIREMHAENNLLQRNLRAAQKELLAQDKMIIQLESDLQIYEIERVKLEDKFYMMELDLEDARAALRKEVLRNQENERLLEEYRRLDEEQRIVDEQRQMVEQERKRQAEEQRQDESWFSPWVWK